MKLKGIGLFAMGTLFGLEGIMVGDGNNDISYAGIREQWPFLEDKGKKFLARKGWFTPPFPTEDQLLKILRRLYLQVEYHVDGSMVYFSCVK